MVVEIGDRQFSHAPHGFSPLFLQALHDGRGQNVRRGVHAATRCEQITNGVGLGPRFEARGTRHRNLGVEFGNFLRAKGRGGPLQEAGRGPEFLHLFF